MTDFIDNGSATIMSPECPVAIVITTDDEICQLRIPKYRGRNAMSSDSSDDEDIVLHESQPNTPTLQPDKSDSVHTIHSQLLMKLLSPEGALVNTKLDSNDTGEKRTVRGKYEIRPIRGTTLYIAECNVDTRFGDFHAYIFQDLIGKHYIIALTYGKIKEKDKPFYIRLHSSCVTSETLRGCDCDCVQQLEGAIKIISEKQQGILFYLLQEGRGAGYVGKSRDRMLVQASCDQISTFEAYQVMGLKKDHRHYENIGQICDLLGIGNAQFVLLTNNPDKIQAMTDLKLNVISTVPLEFDSSPFNVAYLSSKQASGHLLRSASHSTLRGKSAPEPVPLFKPCIVPNAQRFIYCASYYLPMKPINDEILLTEQQFYEMFKYRPIDYYINMPNPCVLHYQALRNNRFLVKIDVNNLQKHEENCRNDPVCELLTTPYWFKVN
ncbi:unnamed protein product [Rotaria sp. Silwood1]|nr:unnamed protein product [Rotaria sp. Silwood1]